MAKFGQNIVAYTTPHGEVKAYDTVYTSEQEHRAIQRCRELRGASCNPRVLHADEFPPNRLRGMAG